MVERIDITKYGCVCLYFCIPRYKTIRFDGYIFVSEIQNYTLDGYILVSRDPETPRPEIQPAQHKTRLYIYKTG